MWIKMKQSYIGELADGAVCFLEGTKYDLPEATLKQLTAKRIRYKKTCAPWDEQIDRKQIALNAAADDLTAASKAVAAANSKVERLDTVAVESQKIADASLLIAQKAKEELDRYKGKSNTHLAKESKRADLDCDCANAVAATADAVFGLAKIAAEDAKLNYEKAKAKHEKLEPKAKSKKQNTKTDNPDAEGQADDAGETGQ